MGLGLLMGIIVGSSGLHFGVLGVGISPSFCVNVCNDVLGGSLFVFRLFYVGPRVEGTWIIMRYLESALASSNAVPAARRRLSVARDKPRKLLLD